MEQPKPAKRNLRQTAAERFRLSFSFIHGFGLFFFIVFTKSRYEMTGLYEFLKLVGYSFLIIAALGRIWAAVYISGRKDNELCRIGPYSIIRNPLYLFSLIGGIGAILSTQKLILLLILISLFINYYFVIKGEEGRLANNFGEEFQKYKNEVNRVIPDFSNYQSIAKFDVHAKVLERAIKHASLFLWVIVIFEGLQCIKIYTDLIPTLFYLPF